MKLVSLNIERDVHLDLVLPFLERTGADVVCLQELFKEDIPRLEAVAGPCFFVPSTRFESPRGLCTEGIGIFSRAPLQDTAARRYYGNEGSPVVFNNASPGHKVATRRYSVALATMELGGGVWRIATTHFPWTPDGSPDEYQRSALAALCEELASEESLAFCGDFNAPRGGEIFSALAERWHDTIPAEYLTSIDISLHKHGKERSEELADKMVDGLFTTPDYRATKVELVSGVSDHCAIVAELEHQG